MTLRSLTGLVTVLYICGGTVSAQKNTSSTDSTTAGSQSQASKGSQDSSSPGGFSIETEMFTYKAVEQNSEIIACDVARFLFGGQASPAPDGSHMPCLVSNPAHVSPGIVLVSSTNTIVSDLQLWRADMATMSVLKKRADLVCIPYKAPGIPPNANNNQSTSTSGNDKEKPVVEKSKGAGMSPPELVSSLYAIGLAMLSHNESITSVSGTVKDNALMNEVARQLRSLNVEVLIPEIYNPTGSGDAPDGSTYAQNLESISKLEQTCTSYITGYVVGDPNRTAISALTTDMQNFEKALIPSPPTGQPNTSSNGPSHLTRVFGADQVARKLFPEGKGNGSDPSQWQYILWLQALESGGSVLHESGYLGTKISFSGGAVDSYAVFRVDGQLTCSGNVFNFQSPTQAKDLGKTYGSRSAISPLDSQSLHSSCALLPPIQK